MSDSRDPEAGQFRADFLRTLQSGDLPAGSTWFLALATGALYSPSRHGLCGFGTPGPDFEGDEICGHVNNAPSETSDKACSSLITEVALDRDDNCGKKWAQTTQPDLRCEQYAGTRHQPFQYPDGVKLAREHPGKGDALCGLQFGPIIEADYSRTPGSEFCGSGLVELTQSDLTCGVSHGESFERDYNCGAQTGGDLSDTDERCGAKLGPLDVYPDDTHATCGRVYGPASATKDYACGNAAPGSDAADRDVRCRTVVADGIIPDDASPEGDSACGVGTNSPGINADAMCRPNTDDSVDYRCGKPSGYGGPAYDDAACSQTQGNGFPAFSTDYTESGGADGTGVGRGLAPPVPRDSYPPPAQEPAVGEEPGKPATPALPGEGDTPAEDEPRPATPEAPDAGSGAASGRPRLRGSSRSPEKDD